MAEQENGKPLRVLIVGCGIAGATAAHALLQRGMEVNVYEQADDVTTLYVGSGIHLWNNTMRALTMLKLDDRVESVSGPGAVVDDMQFLTPKGKLLASVPCGEMAPRVGGDCVGINRAELLPAIANALPEGVVVTGKKVKGYTQEDSGVTLEFEDGDTTSGDVLVGADGSHSTIRTQLRGGYDPPRYAGYTIWQGITTDVTPEMAPLRVFPLIYGPGLRFCYYRVSEDRLYWFAVANAEEGGTDPDGKRRELLLERFESWAFPTGEIIRRTEEHAIHRRDLYDRDPMPTPWGEGRVTLIGDAAHAMTFDIGQGAGQGIEDAVVLARCLAEQDGVVAALRDFEDQRKDRTAHMQKLSRTIGRLGRWKNPVAVRFRNLLTRITLGNRIAHKQFEKDLAYDF